MEGGGQNRGLFLFYFLSFSSSRTYIFLLQLAARRGGAALH